MRGGKTRRKQGGNEGHGDNEVTSGEKMARGMMSDEKVTRDASIRFVRRA